MKNLFFVSLLLVAIFALPLTSSVQWIVGTVEDALDTTSPDDRTIRIWNSTNSQEIFGVIGPSGPSGTPNVYMVDCETLPTPCQVGDTLNVTIVDDGSGYVAKNIVEITVTESGFDSAPNITINTPPTSINLTIEDALTSPQNEIDLTPASTTYATCSGVLQDPEGGSSIQSVVAEFFSSSSSSGSPDDANDHYTNSTCQINSTYGTSEQVMVNCSFEIEYYAEFGSWQCQINATDNYSASTLASDTTTINTLLALGVDPVIEFGAIDNEKVGLEIETKVTNYGNVKMNLTLNGYGSTPGDGNAMECGSPDIPIDYIKFNLTTSNSGDLTLSEFEATYQNLTTNPTTHTFNLDSKQNDLGGEVNASTYWRVYVPQGVSNGCTGNIVFGATQS